MTMASDHGADVVVVSGGIRGQCIAYYLARAGVGVTLVEKGFLGSGASSANAGLANVSQEVPGHYTLFSLLSADMYPQFVAELEAEVDYQRDEYLRVAETDADPEDLTQCREGLISLHASLQFRHDVVVFASDLDLGRIGTTYFARTRDVGRRCANGESGRSRLTKARPDQRHAEPGQLRRRRAGRAVEQAVLDVRLPVCVERGADLHRLRVSDSRTQQ